MIEAPVNQKRSLFLTATIIGLVIIGCFSGYFEYQKYSINKQIKEIQVQTDSMRASSAEKKEISPADLIASAVSVKTELKTLEENQLPWAKIIEKIENTVPKDKTTNEPLINFRSYNGTPEGKISVTATTKTASADPFTDVALLLRAFNLEPSFKNVFIPSINKSLTEQGETVLSFSINFNYKKLTF